MRYLLLLIFLMPCNYGHSQEIKPTRFFEGKNILELQIDPQMHLFFKDEQHRTYKFDGRRFEIIDLGEEAIQKICLVNDYQFLITTSGIWKHQNSTIDHEFDFEAPLEITHVASIGSGKLLLLTKDNFYIYNTARRELSLLENHVDVSEITEVFSFRDRLYFSRGSLLFYGMELLQNQSFENEISFVWESKIPSFKDQILVGVDSVGILISDGIKKRKLYFYGQQNMEHPLSIVEIGSTLYIIDRELGLIRWKPNENQYETIYVPELERSIAINMAKDIWGNIWIGTSNGLIKVPTQKHGFHSVPFLSLNKVTSELSLDKNSDFEYSLIKADQEVSIDVSASFLSSAEPILFQLKLNEGSWSNYQNQGNFRVKAFDQSVNKILIRCTVGREHFDYLEPIIITKPYKAKESAFSIWFLLPMLLILVLMFLGFTQQRKTSEIKKEATRLRLENKALKLEQKTLQLQMNPHFIFNCLASIQGLISLKKNAAAAKYTNGFSQLLRSVLDQSRSDKITLADEIKYLKNYLSLEQLARDNRFDYQITSEVEDMDICIAPMILQPLVENAIIHGVSKLKDRQGQIGIKFVEKQETILCTITDNGVGRPPKEKTNLQTDHKSHATNIIKERGLVDLNFDDLKEDDKPSGTRVTIELLILA